MDYKIEIDCFTKGNAQVVELLDTTTLETVKAVTGNYSEQVTHYHDFREARPSVAMDKARRVFEATDGAIEARVYYAGKHFATFYRDEEVQGGELVEVTKVVR